MFNFPEDITLTVYTSKRAFLLDATTPKGESMLEGLCESPKMLSGEAGKLVMVLGKPKQIRIETGNDLTVAQLMAAFTFRNLNVRFKDGEP